MENRGEKKTFFYSWKKIRSIKIKAKSTFRCPSYDRTVN